MKIIDNIFYFMLGGVIGWFIIFPVIENITESEPTCGIVAEKMWAFQQCLKHQPSCRVNGPQAFIEYFDQRDWAVEHCPVSASGDQLELSE